MITLLYDVALYDKLERSADFSLAHKLCGYSVGFYMMFESLSRVQPHGASMGFHPTELSLPVVFIDTQRYY